MDQYLRYLGKRVRQLREEFGWSQTNLADEMTRYGVNMTQGAIGHIETGYRKPSIEALLALSFTLQVSCDYLLGVSDDASPPTPPLTSAADQEIDRLFAKLSPPRQHELIVIARALADDQTEPSTGQLEQVISAALGLLIETNPAMADALLSQLNDDAAPIARRLILQHHRAE